VRGGGCALFALGVAIALQSAALAADASPPAAHDPPGILPEDSILTRRQHDRLKRESKPAEHPSHSPKLGGYLQVDVPLAVSPGNVLGSSTVLRRLYLAIYGRLGADWKYRGQFGFNKGKAVVSTTVLSYLGFEPAKITLGYQKEPFSLEYMTAPKQRAFTERALPTAVVPGKKIGLTIGGHGRRWTLAGGVFGAKYNNTPSGDPGGNATQARFGESLRGTFAPIATRDFVWEVGVSAATRVADSSHTFGFDSRPEEDVVGARLVNTGQIEDVTSVQNYGGESGVYAGRVTVQGEYLDARLKRSGSLPQLNFDGWYVQATWTLTGGRRRFVPSIGKVLAPTSQPRAVELALRYSALDLNEGGVSGGDEHDITAGVNWYAMHDVLLMVDYTHVQSVVGGAYHGVSSNIVEARAQVVF
jgi:phosphate-selective porin OprO/OprP